jgi:hypothetical protein
MSRHQLKPVGINGKKICFTSDNAAGHDQVNRNPAMQPCRPFQGQFHCGPRGEQIWRLSQHAGAADIQGSARPVTKLPVESAVGKCETQREANSRAPVGRARPRECVHFGRVATHRLCCPLPRGRVPDRAPGFPESGPSHRPRALSRVHSALIRRNIECNASIACRYWY